MSSPWYRWQGQTLLLFCHLQPGAHNDDSAGEHGDRLKIRIAAPPVDGKANKQLIKFIARQFAVSQANVIISSGEGGRQKNLRIDCPRKIPDTLSITPTSKP